MVKYIWDQYFQLFTISVVAQIWWLMSSSETEQNLAAALGKQQGDEQWTRKKKEEAAGAFADLPNSNAVLLA